MNALVIGGTGPSGPFIVNGLLERGYNVVVLHGGFHEIQFSQTVEHIHTDPHFLQTLEDALEARRFDLTVATYGRIRHVVEVMKGKTARLITVGGGGHYAERGDPRWGSLGMPLVVPEDSPLQDDPQGSRTRYLMWFTEQSALKAHAEGHFNVTVFRYPTIYGPHAPADSDWSIVKRILDGRGQFIIPDGGLRLHSRAFAQNAAHAVLLGVDRPTESAGQVYNVADDTPYTLRQRVELMAKALGHEWELVDMPHSLAQNVSPALFRAREHYLRDTTKLRAELGYQDVVPVADAIQRSARWLADHRPGPRGELETMLADPFDYASEDRLIRGFKAALDEAARVRFPKVETGPRYRRPTVPGEPWKPRLDRNRGPGGQ